MTASISRKRAYNLTQAEYNACRRLTFRSNGKMFDAVEYMREGIRPGYVYRVLDEDAKLLAWGILYERGKVQLYTRKSERRKGHASRLVRRIRRDSPVALKAYKAHDEGAETFYNSFPHKIVNRRIDLGN